MSKGYIIDDNNHAFITTDSPNIAEFFKERHPKISVNYVGEGEDLSTEDFLTKSSSFGTNYMDGYKDGAIHGAIKGFLISAGCAAGITFIGLKIKDFVIARLEENKFKKEYYTENPKMLEKYVEMHPEMNAKQIVKKTKAKMSDVEKAIAKVRG